MKKIVTLALIAMMMAITGCSTKADNSATTDDSSNTNTENKKEENQEVSEIWGDNQIKIKGKLLTLPVDIQEFVALGFELEDKRDFQVLSKRSIPGNVMIDKEGYKINVTCSNDTNETLSIHETKVSGIEMGGGTSETSLNIVLMGNIKFGDSVAQVKDKIAEPTKEKTDLDNGDVVLEYGEKYEHYMKLSFSNDKLIHVEFYDRTNK